MVFFASGVSTDAFDVGTYCRDLWEREFCLDM